MYLIFGTFCCCAIVHVFLLFPESRGKTLEEMDELFNDSIWAFRQKDTGSKLDNDVHIAENILNSKAGISPEQIEGIPGTTY